MKRLTILLSLVAISAICWAATLSSEGRTHFEAAKRLFEIAETPSAYKEVVRHLELVTKTDPNYAETYLYLCRVYGKASLQEGESYVSKARQALDTYKRLAPEDKDTYNIENEVLSSLASMPTEKSYTQTHLPLEGKWGYSFNRQQWLIDVGNENGKYTVKVNPSYGASVRKIDDYTFEETTSKTVNEGQTYYDDCDYKAERGYPTSGTYYYDSYRSTFYSRITLNGSVPNVWLYKIRTEYFLKGKKTYSELKDSPTNISNGDLVRF